MLLCVAMPIFAARVEPETATQMARNYLAKSNRANVQIADLSKEIGLSNLYVFDAGEGYVILSADDRVQPVLGYSLSGHIKPDEMPENMRNWLKEYDNEIQFVIDNDLRATSEIIAQWNALKNGEPHRATVVVAPLLTTLWDQGDPYNIFCPTSNGTATYTGCVATAMAQIMRYWNWPIKGSGSHNYKPSGFSTQSVTFSNTTYDWANMIEVYDWTSTGIQDTAVATLMYHCGVSVDMAYSTSGSGAYSYNIPSAMKTYFSYNTAISYKTKAQNSSNWTTLLKTDLNAGRPVQYSGSGTGGGHAFVCDGYDSDNYFHFNWGWSGMYDGYFTVSNLNPGAGGSGSGSTGTYNSSQAAVFSIYPSYSITNAPTNLSATLAQDISHRDVSLSWTSTSGASSYQIFRNRKLIGTSTSTTYVDEGAPYGTNKYYVRGVNSSNGISPNSNEVEISIAFGTPMNFRASFDEAEELFTTSWDALDLATTYNLYCNGRRIGSNITSTTLTFSLSVYGDLNFYVKGADYLGDESDASNSVDLYQDFKGPLVSDLDAELDNNSATIHWTALSSSTGFISQLNGYGGSIWLSEPGNTGFYWAVRFPASQLSYYDGDALLGADTYIYEAGTYQVNAYQCTGDTPSGTPIATGSATYSSNAGWNTITFANPVVLDHTKDLWIVYYCSAATYLLLAELDNDNADLFSTDGSSWEHYSGCTWVVYAQISDGDYTYNLYRNGECIDSALTDTSYVDNNINDNAFYKYTVRTNYYGGESSDSNFSAFVLGTASTNDNDNIYIQRDDYLLLTANSCFTINGTLTNQRPYNLVIENGAQLIANDGVAATIQKNLSEGWNWWAPNLVADNLYEQFEATLDGKGSLLNSQDLGFARFESNQWEGTLDDVALGQMYKIWMDKECLTSLQGVTTSDVEITIVPGNNWIGCPTTRNVGLTELGITPVEGDIITSTTQSATFQNGQWTGELTTLQPGQGYVYFSNATASRKIVFP